jgi:hypothetical protein
MMQGESPTGYGNRMSSWSIRRKLLAQLRTRSGTQALQAPARDGVGD